MSRLKFDLSTFDHPYEFPNLKCLAVERTRLSERELDILVKSFPRLEKLIIKDTKLDPTGVLTSEFSTLAHLDLSNSSIIDFGQIMNLSCLPTLSILMLCSNPISEFHAVQDGFPSLKALNIEDTCLEKLNFLNNLDTFNSLREIRVNGTPLAQRMEQSLRTIVISYLPKITELNGGKITEKERSVSERQFVRDFSDTSNPHQHIDISQSTFRLFPEELDVNQSVFERLFALHGTVEKFAEVSLKRPTKALVKFRNEETEDETEVSVPIKWTVQQLKDKVRDMFDIPVNKQKLYYGDADLLAVCGFDLLRFNDYELRRTNIKDGDTILIRKKN